MRHIDTSHSKLDTKITHLERRTKDQLFNLNQTMKESFAVERSECLDRMDRRALRERIAIERQQAVRDVSLKRDLASWLDKKLREIETKHGSDARNAALLRSLAVRGAASNSRRGGAVSKMSGMLSELENGGTLRRAVSEELLSEVGGFCGDISPPPHLPLAGSSQQQQQGSAGPHSEAIYKGLKVSDRPCMGATDSASPASRRVRRNSAGDEQDQRTSGRHSRRPYHLLPPGTHHLLDLGPSSPTTAGLYPNEEDYDGPMGESQVRLAYSTNSESCQDTTTSQSERGSVASSRDSHDPTAVSAIGARNAVSETRQQLQEKVVVSSASSIECLSVKRGGVTPMSYRDPQREPPRGPPHPPSRGAGVTTTGGGSRLGSGLIRPIPMCYSGNGGPDHLLLQLGEPLQSPPPLKTNGQNGPLQADSAALYKPQMNPLRRFSTEADIHHAMPLVLDGPEEPPPEPAYLPPPYRSPPPSALTGGFGSVVPPLPPPHLYRLPRQVGPLLPPVDEDDYVPQGRGCWTVQPACNYMSSFIPPPKPLNFPGGVADLGKISFDVVSGYRTVSSGI